MQKETIVQHGTWRPFFLGAGRELRREIWYRSLSSSFRTKASTPAEDGDLRLSRGHRPQTDWNMKADDWDSWNPTLLPHHQPTRGRSHTLQPSPQILPVRTLPQKPSSFFELGLFWAWAACSVLLAWPCNKPCSVPNSTLQSLWLHCASDTRTWVQQQCCGIFTAFETCK